MFPRTAVLVVLACLNYGLSRAAEIPLAQLIMAISDHSASIKNFSVTCDYKVIQRNLTTEKLDDPLIVHAVITVDMGGRFKYESFHQRGQNQKNDGSHNVAAYNGSVMKTLEGTPHSFLWGSVKENANTRPWFEDPRSYIYHYFGMPVQKILSEPTARLVATDTWEEHKVAVSETTYKRDIKDEMGMIRLLIDPERGFVVVRRSVSVASPATQGKWFEYAFIEGREYKEIVPGLWLPSQVTSQFGPTPSPENPSPAFVNRTEVVNTNWVVNAELPDGVFELTFPPGIMVKDEQTGKLYRTTNINTASLGQGALKGKELYHKQQQSIRRLWLAAIPLAILAVLVLYRILKRRQHA